MKEEELEEIRGLFQEFRDQVKQVSPIKSAALVARALKGFDNGLCDALDSLEENYLEVADKFEGFIEFFVEESEKTKAAAI